MLLVTFVYTFYVQYNTSVLMHNNFKYLILSWDHFVVDSSGGIVTKIRVEFIQDWVELDVSNGVQSPSLFIPYDKYIQNVHISYQMLSLHKLPQEWALADLLLELK